MPLRAPKMYSFIFGIPAAGLVAEVGAGLEQLFQRDGNQERPPSMR